MAPDHHVVRKHYEQVADTYDDYLSYTGEFVRALTTSIIKELDLRATDRFVDLGGGTGLYTAAVLEQVPLEHPPLLVDPVAEMLERAPADLPAERLHTDALEFASRPVRYDKVLMKESVHHIDDRARLFERLHERLTPGGALLLVHVPPQIEYPLFEAALERARNWHADPDELASLLERAGFAVERKAFEYRHAIAKEQYFAMVGDRYMSVLSTFDDATVEAGLAEMEARHADDDVLEFTDRFDLIAGHKLPHRG